MLNKSFTHYKKKKIHLPGPTWDTSIKNFFRNYKKEKSHNYKKFYLSEATRDTYIF